MYGNTRLRLSITALLRISCRPKGQITCRFIQGKQKNCTPTVPQRIVQQRVPIKFVLSDLSVTHVVSHKHNTKKVGRLKS